MWLKLDDGFATHPKILQAGPLGLVIQIRALCYASHNKTDGFLPRECIHLFLDGLDGAFDWPGHMIARQLWELVPGGYQIHDYLEWNLSRSAQEVILKKLSLAGKKGMKSRWNKENSDITKVITKVNNPVITLHSILLDPPNSLNSSESDLKILSNGHADEFDEFWRTYPNKTGKKAARTAWKNAKDRPSLVDMIQLIEKAKRSEQWRKDNGQYIPNPSTWLNQGRWDDQPRLTSGTRPPPPPPKKDPIGRGLWGKTYGKPEDHGYD